MPIRIPVQGVRVVRDGRSHYPKIGKPFDFTREEIEQLTKANPVCLRHPVNEGGHEAETVTKTTPEASPMKAGNAGQNHGAGKSKDEKNDKEDF